MEVYGAGSGAARSKRPGEYGLLTEGPEGPITCEIDVCGDTRVTMDQAGRLRCDNHTVDPDLREQIIRDRRAEYREQTREDDRHGR